MHTTLSTNTARRIVGACASLVVAGTLAQGALAGGEPKNQPPFTRLVGDRTTQAANRSVSATAPIGQGEAKNESPFTRPVGIRSTQAANASVSGTAPLGQGEAKNEYPFTARIAVASGSGGSGFNWMDAVLGGLVGVSICIAGVGGTLLTRHRVPRTA